MVHEHEHVRISDRWRTVVPSERLGLGTIRLPVPECRRDTAQEGDDSELREVTGCVYVRVCDANTWRDEKGEGAPTKQRKIRREERGGGGQRRSDSIRVMKKMTGDTNKRTPLQSRLRVPTANLEATG